MKTGRLFLAILPLAALLVSCSNKDALSEDNVQTRTLTLKINGSGYGSTRTSGSNPASEAGVKNLAIVIFDGTTVENIKYVGNVQVNDGTITEKITYKASSPKVKVVANVPENIFSGVTNADNFTAALTSLDNTTSTYSDGVFTPSIGDNTSPGTQKSDVLPMVGTAGTIGSDGIAAVSLYRLVSRISLSGVSTDFSNTMYAGWKLKIDEIFLANVPVESSLLSVWDTNDKIAATTSSLMQGETTKTTGYRSYLGSGVLGDVDATTSAYTTNHYFYVFPNSNTTFSNQTKLIIKAELFDASGADKGTYYYPIVINRSQSGTSFNETSLDHDGTVKSNVTYTLDAIIKGKGVLNATDDLKPSDISLNVTVKDWSANLTQTVVFN